MMDNTINDTRLEAQLDAAAAGYTPDNNSIPAEVWAAIAGDTQAQQHIDDDDCYDHTAEPDDQQQTVSQPSTQTATQPQAQQKQPTDRDSLINTTADGVIDTLNISMRDLIDPTSNMPEQIRGSILNALRVAFELENQARPKGSKLSAPEYLPGYVVARVILATGDIKVMLTGQDSHKMICKHYYNDQHGVYRWAGTYDIINARDSAGPVMMAFQRLCPNGTRQDLSTFDREIRRAPRVRIQSDDKLVWFRNGLWDYRTKSLTSYDAENFDRMYPDQITLGKLPVYHPYGPGAVLECDADRHVAEPVIVNPSDGYSWRPSQMLTDPFNDDKEGHASSNIIWQAMQFLIRHVNGAPNLYHFWVNANGMGHNGKGAIWSMMQRLIDKPLEPGDEDLISTGDRVIPIAVEDLDKPYELDQNIMSAYAIVGEESNGSVTYIDKCARAKMLSRAQEMTYRCIREAPFKFRFNGFLLQQSNRAPVFSEKNDSVVSHTVVIRFEKSFDDSKPYIKSDYVQREEVAEWLAYHLTVEMACLDGYSRDELRVLEPNKRDMLAESIPSLRFLDEVIPGLHMEFMPLELLYAMYVIWCDMCGERAVSERALRDDLQQYASHNNYGIRYVGTDERVRTRIPDLNESHPALSTYSESRRCGQNPFVLHDAWLRIDNKRLTDRLEPSMMTQDVGGKTKGRIWRKGGLMRTISWQQFDVAEDDDDE